MRNDYITKGFVRRSLDCLIEKFSKEPEKAEYIKQREEFVCSMRTTTARKYLYNETIEVINDPYRWVSETQKEKGMPSLYTNEVRFY